MNHTYTQPHTSNPNTNTLNIVVVILDSYLRSNSQLFLLIPRNKYTHLPQYLRMLIMYIRLNMGLFIDLIMGRYLLISFRRSRVSLNTLIKYRLKIMINVVGLRLLLLLMKSICFIFHVWRLLGFRWRDH